MQFESTNIKATAVAVPELRATAVVVRAGGTIAALKIMAETAVTALTAAIYAPEMVLGVQAQIIKAAALTGYFLKYLQREDAAQFTDAMVLRLQRSLTELTLIADEARVTLGKGLSDSYALTDEYLVSVTKGLSDELGLTDSMVVAISRQLDEPVYIQDPIAKALSTGRDDHFTIDEGPSKDPYAIDYFASDDYAYSGRPHIKFIKGATDSGAFTDSHYKLVNKGLTEPLALTETMTRYMTRQLADNIGVTDDLDGVASLEDDQVMAFRKVITDTFAVGDTVFIVTSFVRNFTEAVSLSDAAYANMTKVLSDITGLSDTALFNLSRSVSDSSAASDAATKSIGKASSDSASVTDTGSLRMQGYCSFSYFAEDYVGTSLTF
jgi:hypothetical protein